MIKKILFISNHASFFFSHRYNIFKEAKRKKINFKLIIGIAASKIMDKIAFKRFKLDNVDYTQYKYSHSKISLRNDFVSLVKIKDVINRQKPDVVHSASPKANLFAIILSNFFKEIKFVISFSGLGYIFINYNQSILLHIKKIIFIKTLKIFLKGSKNVHLIMQNKDDLSLFKEILRLKKSNIHLISGGSGVDLKKFNPYKKKDTKNILMISRITKNKGSIEYFKCAELLKKKYKKWNFLFAGTNDYETPDKIDIEYLKYLKKNKIIKFLGYKQDIHKILKKTEIFCLPSYREGMPKVTLEALSTGVPVVTTNVTGCRDSILNNYNGLLCKPHDYLDLSKKIEKLILNKKLRKKFSLNASNYAKKNFSITSVTKNIYKIYNL
tara:strand:+ start:58 stop:1203 length:1146 start_codon:yes stop_codon:yes gene_type:complete